MVGRSLALIGRNLTLLGSSKIAAASARQLVDVEALVDALVVRQAEAGEAGIGAADQLPARLDLIERAGGGGSGSSAIPARQGMRKRMKNLLEATTAPPARSRRRQPAARSR